MVYIILTHIAFNVSERETLFRKKYIITRIKLVGVKWLLFWQIRIYGGFRTDVNPLHPAPPARNGSGDVP
jgi:hypothetical protein